MVVALVSDHLDLSIILLRPDWSSYHAEMAWDTRTRWTVSFAKYKDQVSSDPWFTWLPIIADHTASMARIIASVSAFNAQSVIIV